MPMAVIRRCACSGSADYFQYYPICPGAQISDRIIAVNMTGTMIIMVIAVLSVYLDENYLADICLIYAMISFLGVVVLCKVYTGAYLREKHMKANLEAVEDNLNRQGLDLEFARKEEEDGI